MTMARMCIMCSEQVEGGEPVENTQVIQIIRAIKKKLNMATNNHLVVCTQHLEDYKKKRSGFERKLILHIAGGAILLLVSIVLPLMSSRPIELTSVFMIFLLALFLVGLAMLSYVPPLLKAGASGSISGGKSQDAKTHAEKPHSPSETKHSKAHHLHSKKSRENHSGKKRG